MMLGMLGIRKAGAAGLGTVSCATGAARGIGGGG